MENVANFQFSTEVLSKPCGWLMEQKKVSDDHSSSTDVCVCVCGGGVWDGV